MAAITEPVRYNGATCRQAWHKTRESIIAISRHRRARDVPATEISDAPAERTRLRWFATAATLNQTVVTENRAS